MTQAELVPPPFPTVTVRTADGDVILPCEPVGEYLAITPAYQMLGDDNGFEATLTGTFEVHLRATGARLTTSGGCIVCARRYAKLLAQSPIDWSKTDDEIAAQTKTLTGPTRTELASGRDLEWSCDAQWCDQSGPGIVLVPVG